MGEKKFRNSAKKVRGAQAPPHEVVSNSLIYLFTCLFFRAMSLIRQIGLIPAGCQPWNLNVVDASGNRFAYAATLAIYIYEVSSLFLEGKTINNQSITGA